MKTIDRTTIFLVIVAIMCFVLPFLTQMSIDSKIICVIAGLNSLNTGLIKNIKTRRLISIISLCLLIYPIVHLFGK